MIFPSFPIKCVSVHLSVLESLKPREKNMKARKNGLFSHCCLQDVFQFKDVFYSICNNLIRFRCLYISFPTVKLLISNCFGSFSVGGERNPQF
jgi:hypothetical protein